MHRDLNDIIPPSKRRALDLGRPTTEPVSHLPREIERPAPPPPMQEAVPPMPPLPKRRRFRGGKRFPLGTALIALVVVAGCALVLYAFAGAKVTIVPHTAEATITADLSAKAGEGDLPFQLVTVEKTATTNVPAESTQTSNDAASGRIVISNKQTTTQALIKNTRFQSAAGLIYRIRDSISIPAGGFVTATVYADEAGEKYNTGPTTFTVPGLKGSKAFDLVTARSSGSISGGFSGTRPTVSQATKDKQFGEMQTKLAADLQKELSGKVPAGYVLLPGASFTTYTPASDAAGASGTVTLTEAGSITAVIFPADALAKTIAFKSVGSYGGEPVTLKNVQNLTVKPAQTSIAPDATTFDFNLSGGTTVIWQVDPAKIGGAVAGKTRDTAEIALKSFPEVDKATLVLRPFWASKFPADPSKIKVSVNEPGGGK